MTLQKFSDKNFISMFKNKLKSALPFPIIGFVIIFCFTVIAPFSEIIHLNRDINYHSSGLIQLENVKYILFGEITSIDYGFSDSAVIMYFTLVIASILCAIMVFRDLSNKKTANVYYSLGFSRNKLFASTYLSGAVCVLSMTIIPLVLSFIINAFVFGISKELMTALIFSVSALCNISLLAYTVAAIAMILSGMLVEGIFFSFFLNSVSAIFACATCMFSDGLLVGGGFVNPNYYYYSTFGESFVSAFLGKTAFLNSLAHSAVEMGNYASCLYSSFGGLGGEFRTVDNWKTPNFIPLLVWTVILAGLLFLAFYAFNRKKPENIGFFASNKNLYRIFYCTVIVALSSVGCAGGGNYTKGLTWIFILIALVIAIIIMTILALVFSKLSKMKFKQEFKMFGIYSLVTIAFALVFSSGFFGYANRIPDIDEVKSVKITRFSDGFNCTTELYIADSYGSTKPISTDSFYGDFDYLFFTKTEIADIQSLHKDLIKADNAKISADYKTTKISSPIMISYELANGKTISRHYRRITPQIIEKYISCKGISKEIKQDMINTLANAVAAASADTANPDNYTDANKFVTVFSRDLTRATNVELTSVQLNSLLTAYKNDVEKLPLKTLLKPSSDCIGVIAIRDDYSVVTEYDINGDPIYEGVASELEYSSLNMHCNGECDYITITEDMANCIKWAKEAGIYKYFAIDHKVGITTVDVAYNNSPVIKVSLASETSTNLLFNADSYRAGDSYEFMLGVSGEGNLPLAGSHTVGDLTTEEIRYIRENAYTTYLTTQTGYFIKITTDEEKPLNATLFIPENKLTPELKVKFSVADEMSEEEVRYEHNTSAIIIE